MCKLCTSPQVLISTKIAINLPNGTSHRWPNVIIMHNIDSAEPIAEECWWEFEMHFTYLCFAHISKCFYKVLLKILKDNITRKLRCFLF